jgi:hypothetical protein
MMTTETETARPEVWVGCLGCYTAGALVGAWVDAIDAAELEPHMAGLAAAGLTLPACGRSTADEPWCFDLQGFGPFASGEMSPAEAARIAEAMAAIEADGFELEAVGAWLQWSGDRLETWDEPTREAFEDAFAGEYDSGADYAEQSFEDMGGWSVYGGAGGSDRPADLSGTWPFYCIDWERAWRELELGDGYAAVDAGPGRVYVFRP